MGNEQASQSSQQTPGQESANGAPAQAGVTRAELESEIARLTQAIEKNWKGAQSRQDGFESRVQRNLQNLEGMLKNLSESGITVTSEQRAHLQQKAMLDAFEPPTSQAPAVQQATPEGEGEIDPMVQGILDFMTEQGVMIEDDDPELPALTKALESGHPGKIMSAAVKAVGDKRTRLANNANPNVAAARSPTLGAGGTPTSPLAGKIVKSDDLWAEVIKPK